jgi:uncharacterized protein YebE (UPF0316 family)
MDMTFTFEALAGGALIFGLRVLNMTLDTLRVLFVMRGKKPLVWVLGFFQTIVFVVAITSVLANLDNLFNLFGYAAGFATGNVIGIALEQRLAIGHTRVNIISPRRGAAIAEHLREGGYAVTEIPARGKDGMVTMLECSVRRREATKVDQLIRDVDETAFVTAEDVRPVRRGYWRA